MVGSSKHCTYSVFEKLTNGSTEELVSAMDNSRIILLAGATGGIKGDSPELVEYTGMKNLINDVKDSVKLENGKLLFVGGEGPFERTFKNLRFVHVGSVWSKPTRETRFGSKQTTSGCESKQGA
ncbi:unnamed protein product [Brassica oleracea var. botrytis]|uniref:(rape) hypothetical protein n=1 Tax=Brassica napus TaxID=3708 RepID=A0A816IFM0_BRANA|nr:unnamed protein product [Brassica napus]